MRVLNLTVYAFAVCGALAALAGCGSRQSAAPGVMPQAPANQARSARPASATPIHHLIVVVQVGRSFDNLFAGYPGAESAKFGLSSGGERVPLKPITLQTNGKPGHGVTLPATFPSYVTEYDGGKMDGFNLIRFGAEGKGREAGDYPYAYVVRSEAKPYWSLAKRYALADEMFATERGAGSFAGSDVLIAGSTGLDRSYVTGVTNPGGCDAPSGTRTILANGRKGPPPCFTWKTIAGTLDAANVSWKYYTLLCSGQYADPGCLWNAFEAIKDVRYGPDWSRNISVPNTNLFSDLKAGKLPSVSWITPTLADSDDSLSGSKAGPAWVRSIANAVRQSSYWKDTAIVVIWTDWGGYYDNVPPKFLDKAGLGFRIPMLVLSPYDKHDYVSHVHYEHASVLRFIEDNWGLPPLGISDERAASFNDMFDF